MTGVSKDLEEKFLASMLPDNIDLGRFVVHEEQVEESRQRKRD